MALVSLYAAWFRLGTKPEAGLDERQRTYPGSPHELRRTEALIAKIGAESLDSLMNNLLSDDQLYFEPSLAEKSRFGQTDLERCLSSRRTLRLWQVLRELPEGERVSVVRRLSDQVRATNRVAVEAILKRQVDRSAPENKQSLLATKMATCACWWMMIDFGGVKLLLEDMAQTEAYALQVGQKVAGDKRYPMDLRRSLDRNLQPDNACKLNLLVLAIERHPGLKPDRLGALRQTLNKYGLQTKRLVLAGWDASVGPFDVVHAFEGVPIDRTKGATEYNLYVWGEYRSGDPQDVILDRSTGRHVRAYNEDQIREFQERVLEEVKRLAADVASTDG